MFILKKKEKMIQRAIKSNYKDINRLIAFLLACE